MLSPLSAPPNSNPTPEGTTTAAVALNWISASDVRIKSVPSVEICSPLSVSPNSKTEPEILTAPNELRTRSEPDEIVRNVPSPSIFSLSWPNVKPIFVGRLMSPPAPTSKWISVPSP